MNQLMVLACTTGDLEQLKNIISNEVMVRWKILTLTFIACSYNRHNVVYWLMATYPMIFNLTNNCCILKNYVDSYNRTYGSDLILGRIQATYTYNNHLMTGLIYQIVRFGWHSFQINMSCCLSDKNIPLFLESEYSL